MQCGDALHLEDAASGQLRRLSDALPLLAQRDNSAVLASVGLAAGVLPCRPRDLDAFTLALNGQRIGSFFTVDFNLRAQLRTGTTINLGVVNIADKDPPLVRQNYNYDPYTAGALGCQIRVGVTQKF